jgi:tetratricopeptide (TPR) repeat protein
MDAAAVLQAAYFALQGNDPAQAVVLSKSVLRQAPGNEDALSLLGQALLAQQRHRDACRVFETLTGINPANPLHWANYGTALRCCGALAEALTAYARAAAAGANSAQFLLNVGLLHLDRGHYDHARRVLADSRAAAPRDAGIAIQYAQCCYELLRIEEATAALSDWAQFDSLTSEHLGQIALLLLNLGNPGESAVVVRRLLQKPAPDPLALLKLCQIFERNNQLDDAMAGLRALRADARAVELGDDLEMLDAQLAQRGKEHGRALDLFSGIAAREAEHRRHLALFPMAKSLHALSQTTQAWQALQDAHAAQLKQLARSHPEIATHAEPPLLITRQSCDSEDIACWSNAQAPPPEQSPVFVVAFPRSGTTLLEQALDAHPLLVSMDEQPFVQQLVDRIEEMGVDYPMKLGRLTDVQLVELREFYSALVATKVKVAHGMRVVDKNPLNLLRLPVIRRLFPNASIILAIRHPLDVIVSCYSQHFRAPEFALLCKDPATLARGFRRCFDFWYSQVSLLQPPVFELRYEDLVTDFEANMRKSAAHIGISWNDAMLRPGDKAREKGYISTPSYSQVVEPVHQRSVGRWEVHRDRLSEAVAEVQPYLSRWNYRV